MALSMRVPNDGAGLTHNSDQGGHYKRLAFGRRCIEMGVRPSMGSVGDEVHLPMSRS